MGLLDKFKSMIVPEPDPYEGDISPKPLEEDEEEIIPTRQQPVEPEIGVAGADTSSAVELKVVKPENYASVTEIADHLLNNNTVVLNLEATNREVAKRLIDFLAGVAYSIGGQLKNVSNNTYIITPRNVDVADARVKSNSAPQPAPAQNTAPAIGLTSDTLF